MREELNNLLDWMITWNYSINNGKWDSDISIAEGIDNDQLIDLYLKELFDSKKIN